MFLKVFSFQLLDSFDLSQLYGFAYQNLKDRLCFHFEVEKVGVLVMHLNHLVMTFGVRNEYGRGLYSN